MPETARKAGRSENRATSSSAATRSSATTSRREPLRCSGSGRTHFSSGASPSARCPPCFARRSSRRRTEPGSPPWFRRLTADLDDRRDQRTPPVPDHVLVCGGRLGEQCGRPEHVEECEGREQQRQRDEGESLFRDDRVHDCSSVPSLSGGFLRPPCPGDDHRLRRLPRGRGRVPFRAFTCWSRGHGACRKGLYSLGLPATV